MQLSDQVPYTYHHHPPHHVDIVHRAEAGFRQIWSMKCGETRVIIIERGQS